jgi:hypothetical protein
MPRSFDRSRLGRSAFALVLFVAPATTQGQDSAPAAGDTSALALARLSLVERQVELEKKGARWQAAAEGGPLQVGEAIRTGPDAVARLELPWMALTLSPGSTLRFPDAFLLSATLDGGRALVDAPGLETLKLVTAGAEVRGQGRAVVRRQDRSTLVTCLAGRFFVEAMGKVVALTPGRGSVVTDGSAPGAARDVIAAPSEGLWPAQDPVFVAPAESLELRWRADAPSYQLELLPVGSDVVLMQRDVSAPPVRIEVPWEGSAPLVYMPVELPPSPALLNKSNFTATLLSMPP